MVCIHLGSHNLSLASSPTNSPRPRVLTPRVTETVVLLTTLYSKHFSRVNTLSTLPLFDGQTTEMWGKKTHLKFSEKSDSLMVNLPVRFSHVLDKSQGQTTCLASKAWIPTSSSAAHVYQSQTKDVNSTRLQTPHVYTSKSTVPVLTSTNTASLHFLTMFEFRQCETIVPQKARGQV